MEATQVQIPMIGQAWPEQGGVYIGARLIEGDVHHVVIPGGVEHDIPASHDDAAERISGKGDINGFSDWRNGSQEDYMLAYINSPEKFNRKGFESIYVSATPYGSHLAWAIVFECGHVYYWYRFNEFLVRPFRSIIASSI